MKEAIHYNIQTELPDRGYLWSLLDESLKQTHRNASITGILLIQLHNLSGIKSMIGEEGANEFIKVMASRIKNSLWDLDTAVRFEEDKFVIVANSIAKLEDIHVVMKKTHEYLATECTILDRKITPDTTIGIVLLPMDAMEPDEVMSNAAIALSNAKIHGDSFYSYFNQEMGKKIEDQEAIKNSILSTLAAESFVLMLQPKIDTKTREICGVEALVRMRDSEGNIVSPDEFIPVAETSNLILKIGDWVLANAFSLSNLFKESGIELPVSINISDVQFKKSAALLSTLHKLAANGENTSSNIILEISENTITSDPMLAAALLSEIKSYGYQISIDGFGSGFSSLSVLKELKVDEIKIDRHFLSDVPSDEKSTAILKSIIMLGKSMGFRVVGMGVETEEQLAVLKEHDCDEMQGYLISEPMSKDDFVDWHKDYKS